MSAVWIGFLGVIVGSVITIAWSWLAVIRQELSDAMVAARLVDENLAALRNALRNATDPGSNLPAAADPHVDTQVWKKNRAALARVLGEQQWTEVSIVYRPPGRPLTDDSLDAHAVAARSALHQLVAGKRYVIPQRWRNILSRTHQRS